MKEKIHLSSSNINDNSFIKEILTQSNLSIENYIEKFESKLEDYYDNDKKIVALNSGTSAIHLALILSGVKKGDEVLCQSFTYIATVNPVIYQNANPIFIDSEKETWNMCPVFLEEAIKDRISKGKKPKAIIFVHLYGMPAKIDEIVAVANKYEISLIEDAAEALGSKYKGKKCGSFGDFGILSFNNNKIISTLGGGALLCKTNKEKQTAIFYATQAKEDKNYYEHKEIGYNYRINSFAALIGIKQLGVLEHNINRRRYINLYYRQFFSNKHHIRFFQEKDNNYKSNHWLSCILFNDFFYEKNKEKLMSVLSNNNIETRSLWKPMHLQPVFKNNLFYGSNVCENLFNRGVCLPSGSNLKNDDLKRITLTINNLL